ncbi:MAG TPA: hypothetical protein VG889_12145 [Rhizomicrobium sp.]|nr:hypothetical protein [Rhizomicrobium sp.]
MTFSLYLRGGLASSFHKLADGKLLPGDPVAPPGRPALRPAAGR